MELIYAIANHERTNLRKLDGGPCFYCKKEIEIQYVRHRLRGGANRGAYVERIDRSNRVDIQFDKNVAYPCHLACWKGEIFK